MGLMRVHSHDPNPYIYSNDWMCMHALMTRQSSTCDKKLIKISLTSQSRILGLGLIEADKPPLFSIGELIEALVEPKFR